MKKNFIYLIISFIGFMVYFTPSNASNYIMQQDEKEFARLDLQSSLLDTSFVSVLQNLHTICSLEGITFVDFGCGASSIYPIVTRFIGSTGSYIGIDTSEKHIMLSQAKYQDACYIVGNEYSQQVIQSIGEANVVYIRLVVMHQQDPAAFIKQIYDSMVAGSILVIQEVVNSAECKCIKKAKYPVIAQSAVIRDAVGVQCGFDYSYAEKKLDDCLSNLGPKKLTHLSLKLFAPLKNVKILMRKFFHNLAPTIVRQEIVQGQDIQQYLKRVAKLPDTDEAVMIGVLHTYIVNK